MAANQKGAGKAASAEGKSKEAGKKGKEGISRGDKEAGMRGVPARNNSAAAIKIPAAADAFKQRAKAQRGQRDALLPRKELPILRLDRKRKYYQQWKAEWGRVPAIALQGLRELFYGDKGDDILPQAIFGKADSTGAGSAGGRSGIRAVGRVFGIEPETILAWLVEASKHFEAFNNYMLHQLEVKQVQLDEMYGVVRGYQAGELSEAEAIARLDKKKRGIWLWTAIEPVSKFWLAYVVGERGEGSAWSIVHRVASIIKEGIIPLFITDGNRAYEAPILSHYGQWREPEEGERKARWMPQSGLNYAQVVKKRRRRRIVSVSKRIVFGTMDGVKEILSPFGWQINTAFVERLNLTIRQLVSGLGRRANTLLLSPEALERQVVLAQTYYNFCLPSRSLEIAPTEESIAQERTPAMALDVTDHIWSLKGVLLFRPPPFPQGS